MLSDLNQTKILEHNKPRGTRSILVTLGLLQLRYLVNNIEKRCKTREIKQRFKEGGTKVHVLNVLFDKVDSVVTSLRAPQHTTATFKLVCLFHFSLLQDWCLQQNRSGPWGYHGPWLITQLFEADSMQMAIEPFSHRQPRKPTEDPEAALASPWCWSTFWTVHQGGNVNHDKGRTVFV